MLRDGLMHAKVVLGMDARFGAAIPRRYRLTGMSPMLLRARRDGAVGAWQPVIT